MRKSNFSILFLILLILLVWVLPAFAAPSDVLVIDAGYSKRIPITGYGTKSGATVSVNEVATGLIHKTTLTFAATPLTVRDTEQGGGVKVYDFPEGRIAILGATGKVNFTTTSVLASTLNAGVSSRWGVGTVTQANATLATTEQDILPVTTFSSSATINVAPTAVPAALAASAQFDGTTTATSAFLNISVPLATDIDADATVTATGTVTITWMNLGDY